MFKRTAAYQPKYLVEEARLAREQFGKSVSKLLRVARVSGTDMTARTDRLHAYSNLDGEAPVFVDESTRLFRADPAHRVQPLLLLHHLLLSSYQPVLTGDD